jgi:hypothetical protein
MADIFDYLLWRGDLTFEKSPFNPVDNIILSQLAYLPLDGIVPGPDEKAGITVALAVEVLAERLANNTLQRGTSVLSDRCAGLQGSMMFKEDPAFMSALGRANRFKNLLLHSYVNRIDTDREEQFSAVCLNHGAFTFIVYRGTDATVVGWKEDFNMSFCEAVPAQLEAVSYLETAARKTRGALIPCGHSKGGNLAVYAAASCSKKTRKRIARIYSNDAPGFHSRFIESDGFREIRQRIHSFVPQTSIVGMLFEHGNNYTVIKSSQTGILQHDMYSWEVTHNDMVYLDGVDQGSRFADKTLREWLGGLDNDRRRQFAETLFGILNDAEIESFSASGTDWPRAAVSMIKSLGNIDRDTKKNFHKILVSLFTAAKNNIEMLLPESQREK